MPEELVTILAAERDRYAMHSCEVLFVELDYLIERTATDVPVLQRVATVLLVEASCSAADIQSGICSPNVSEAYCPSS